MEHPVRFGISLMCRDKKRLVKVANALMQHGFIGFEWDYVMRDTYEEYRLSVDGVGKRWLKEFHKLLR